MTGYALHSSVILFYSLRITSNLPHYMTAHKSNKIRLDVLLFEKGLVESREKSRALILEGQVTVNGTVIDKAGTPVKPDVDIKIAPHLGASELILDLLISAANSV